MTDEIPNIARMYDYWLGGKDTIMDANGFPTLRGLAVGDWGDFELDLDLLFEFGLRSLLDGIGALIERRPMLKILPVPSG